MLIGFLSPQVPEVVAQNSIFEEFTPSSYGTCFGISFIEFISKMMHFVSNKSNLEICFACCSAVNLFALNKSHTTMFVWNCSNCFVMVVKSLVASMKYEAQFISASLKKNIQKFSFCFFGESVVYSLLITQKLPAKVPANVFQIQVQY